MINLVKVRDRQEGNLKAHDILKGIVDGETLLALSGGTSPDYKRMIVDPADMIPGAICVVDERYGEPFHENSNELLLKNAGIFDFAKKHSIDIHKILSGKSIIDTEKDCDSAIGDLFAKYPKRVGIMGVGTNLHTAGIFPNSLAGRSASLVVGETVVDELPKRITLTLKALGEFQNFVILMFGEEKKKALSIILDEGENDMQKYPAIFYRKNSAKSYLITDLDVKR